MERKALILLAVLAGCLVAGCSGGGTMTSATPDEQKHYANPIKEPPPEAGNFGGPPSDSKGGS